MSAEVPASRRARIILKKGDTIFLLRKTHADGRPYWCFPGGGLEGEETPQEAVRREAMEELSIMLTRVEQLDELRQEVNGRALHEYFFLVETADDVRVNLQDREMRESVPEWVALKKLSELRVFPAAVAVRLAEHFGS